jgi:menaquinone-dependent protoporphyrinogen oxidase
MSTNVKINRRRFLTLAGGTVGVTALACCGLTALGTRQPEIEFVESNCGDGNETSDNNILVAYASKCGSTGQVAEAIGQALCGGGASVDVQFAKDVTDVSPYRAIVVGSAIRMGRWLPEAVKFVEMHRDALSNMPVAYFTVCMTLQEDTEENHREVATYIDPIREMVQPIDVGAFAGAMDYDKLSPLFQLMIKGMDVPEGDFRDWDSIRTWGTNLYPMLLNA